MKFTSEYFKDITSLAKEKDRLYDLDKDRRDREKYVRRFYNGQALFSDEELARDDRSENTNHLIGYKNLANIQSNIFAVYSSGNQLFEVTVNLGQPEIDVKAGQHITNYFNQAIYGSGKFENVWQSVSGEICLTGRAPLVHDRHGWCPRVAPNMLLPEESTGVPSSTQYAFIPYELTIARLRVLEESVKGEKSKHINLSAVRQLIKAIESQIGDEVISHNTDQRGKELADPVVGEHLFSDAKTKLRAWKYYEPRYDAAKKRTVVACTLFTESFHPESAANRETSGVDPLVISYVATEFDSVEQWLHVFIVDSQIGGLKTFSSTKGIAELTFNSDADAEELLNDQIAGDKQRARPKWKIGNEADRQQVNSWDVTRDSVVPSGVEPVQMFAAGNLLAPFSMLMQNSSTLSGGSFSNTGKGQELRQQAVERQGQTASMSNNRMSAIYTSGNRLGAEMLRRFLVDPVPPAHPDFDDIMWFREQLELVGVEYKKLAEMSYGRFRFLTVRMAQVVGSGDRESELFVAEQLMAQYPNFQPEARPTVLRKYVTLLTRNPSLAESLVSIPEVIISAQRIGAENEFDTIRRRAALGEPLSIGRDDVDEDHVQTHAKDIQAFLAELQMRPGTPLDAVALTGVFQHTGAHLSRMDAMPASQAAATQWRGILTALANEAKPILAQIQEQQQAQQQQQGPPLTAKEQADILLKTGKLKLDAHKLGLAEAQQADVVESRKSRERQGDRKQYSSEVKSAEQIRLANENLNLQKKKVAQDGRKQASSAKASK